MAVVDRAFTASLSQIYQKHQTELRDELLLDRMETLKLQRFLFLLWQFQVIFLRMGGGERFSQPGAPV